MKRSQSIRIANAQERIERAASHDDRWFGHRVVQTIADGMCFLHAFIMELGLEDLELVWDIASVLMYELATRVNVWK